MRLCGLYPPSIKGLWVRERGAQHESRNVLFSHVVRLVTLHTRRFPLKSDTPSASLEANHS